MCSISGFISEKPLPNAIARRLSSALLFHGSDRGKQSAGIFIRGTGHTLLKKACSPFQFIESEEFRSLWQEDLGTTLVLCHTRMPTSGGTGDAQAHPFAVGNTVAVHNGGIYNVKELREKYGLSKDSGVDSEIICSAMDKLGPAGLGNVIADMRGSASVAILHNDKLYVGADGNPFEYFTFTYDGGDITVFASTQSMVQEALHHVWLFEDHLMRTESLKKAKLFELSADGTTTEVGPFSTASFSNYSGRDWSHESSWRTPTQGGGTITAPQNKKKKRVPWDLPPGFYTAQRFGGRQSWAYSASLAAVGKAQQQQGGRSGQRKKKDRNRNSALATNSRN